MGQNLFGWQMLRFDMSALECAVHQMCTAEQERRGKTGGRQAGHKRHFYARRTGCPWRDLPERYGLPLRFLLTPSETHDAPPCRILLDAVQPSQMLLNELEQFDHEQLRINIGIGLKYVKKRCDGTD